MIWVIAVIAIRAAAVSVTPLRKCLTRTLPRMDFQSGKMKNTKSVPGRKIIKPPNRPMKKA